MLSLVFVACCTASILRVAETMSLAGFGSFTSPEDFYEQLDLFAIFNSRADLFRDSHGDLFDRMTTALKVDTREETIQFFLSHNGPEIRLALESILANTNDIVIASLLVDPLKTATSLNLKPLVDLISDFARIVNSPCLFDYLPTFFREPRNYEMAFTPINRATYRVSRNVNGLIGILHDEKEDVVNRPYHQVVTWDLKIISIEMHNLREKRAVVSKLVDLRSGCAVYVKRRFSRSQFIPQMRLFFAHDLHDDSLKIWRRDFEEERLPDQWQPTRFGNFALHPDLATISAEVEDAGWLRYSIASNSSVEYPYRIIWTVDFQSQLLHPRQFDLNIFGGRFLDTPLMERNDEKYFGTAFMAALHDHDDPLHRRFVDAVLARDLFMSLDLLKKLKVQIFKK